MPPEKDSNPSSILLLLRHGEAESLAGQSDPDRALTRRGRAQARKSGRQLIDGALRPDVIVASPAVRARATAEIIVELIRDEVELHWEPRIYEASLATLLEIAGERISPGQRMLLVGHNPGLSYLLGYLCGHREHGGLSTGEWAGIALPAGPIEHARGQGRRLPAQ